MRYRENATAISRPATGGASAKLASLRNKISRFCTITSFQSFCLALVVFCGAIAFGQTDESQPTAPAGAGSTFVHSQFGGQIFGFDIDQNGTEGLLSEAKSLPNGDVLAAVETFDQTTGNIISVVELTDPSHSQDDFITWGVVGNSVGLFEHEHVGTLYVNSRTFNVLNPLNTNRITGVWTPPVGAQHIIMGVTHSQGVPNVAVFAYDNSGQFIPWVFSSNVAQNTFGPIVMITDSTNFGSVPPPIAYDSATNQALLGGGTGAFGRRPVIGVVDLTAGSFTEFEGIGFGFVNGMAIDSADGIFCTDTEDDAGVEFYNLSTQTGFTVTLPGSGGQQFYSGADVEFDSIHKLFLVAQPNSSSAPSGSTIYVYDVQGNLQETINGFSFSTSFTVSPLYIALHASLRSGYVNYGMNELQSFTY